MPGQILSDAQARAVVRLQLDDSQAVEADETALQLVIRETERFGDLLDAPAMQNQPRHEQEARVRYDLALLRQREPCHRGLPLPHGADDVGDLQSQQFADLIDALEGKVGRGEQPLDAGLAQFEPPGDIRIGSRWSREARFVAQIVVIPDYYLRNETGFEGLKGVQRLYDVDIMALVSYDQVTHRDDNSLSLGYLTIVGAYLLKGSRHDVTTLMDLAVVDPASRALILRAGGTDSRHGFWRSSAPCYWRG